MIADGTVENVFGPAGLAEQVTDSSQATQFAGADALGSIRLITDGSGNVVGTGSYSAWGTPDSGSMTLGGFGFTGEQVDPETGFVYLRNRFYDPTTGRFLTPDPLGFAGSGVNLYAYVGNSPTNGTDPSGLGDNPEGLLTAEFGAIQEGIATDVGPREYVTYQWGAGLQGEEAPIYGPVLPPEPPAGAGAFGPAGEGEFCPVTEGEGNGGNRIIRPIRGGSGENEPSTNRPTGKSRIRAANLPATGRIRYVPPDYVSSTADLPTANSPRGMGTWINTETFGFGMRSPFDAVERAMSARSRASKRVRHNPRRACLSAR